ncbi:MAG: DUF4924 family protein [Flavobacteriales bacterium]|nr:DUF4924 family protein [Flavobacteriales bacterium]
MLVSSQKKEENIAEYILYMWQIEALIRSCNFSIYELEDAVISNYGVSGKEQLEITKWYTKLIAEMKSQGIKKVGHLQALKEIISELVLLHNMLINLFKDEKYLLLYGRALPNIDALLAKSGTTKLNEIEICLNGLFGKLSLKMLNKPISEDTEKAIESFSKLIAFLTQKYHDMKAGKFVLPDSAKN